MASAQAVAFPYSAKDASLISARSEFLDARDAVGGPNQPGPSAVEADQLPLVPAPKQVILCCKALHLPEFFGLLPSARLLGACKLRSHSDDDIGLVKASHIAVTSAFLSNRNPPFSFNLNLKSARLLVSIISTTRFASTYCRSNLEHQLLIGFDISRAERLLVSAGGDLLSWQRPHCEHG